MTKATRNGLAKRAARAIFGRVLRLYFREIEVTGEPPLADTAGRIFVANHVNGLVDPALVLSLCACPISPIAKSTLWNIPGLRWLLDIADAVPVVRRRDNPEKSGADNDAIFEKISEHLGFGGNVLIFPEGTSHNEPGVLPLKTGAARMLSRAKSEGSHGLSFQAVGLEFDARDTFRSRVLVIYGPVRAIDEVTADSSEALIRAVALQMRQDLDELLLTSDSWEERVLLARVASMFALAKGDASLAVSNAIGRRVELARNRLALTDLDKLRTLKDAVREYFARIDVAKTSDEVVAGASAASSPSPTGSGILLLPLVAVATMLFWLPYQLPRFVAGRLRGSPDVVSTYKLGVGLVAYPVWLFGLLLAAFTTLPFWVAVCCTLGVFASLFAALRWLDRRDRIRSLGCMPSPDVLASLKTQRAQVIALLETVV
jgi:glycerol-3-phosphate O-acyltransferase / dihydroxyacetone phosphate acyltransferase